MGGRLFRVLLMLLPAEFRSDYGREMEATFKAEAAEARGAVGLRLWMANKTAASITPVIEPRPPSTSTFSSAISGSARSGSGWRSAPPPEKSGA